LMTAGSAFLIVGSLCETADSESHLTQTPYNSDARQDNYCDQRD